ncbi:MAG: right-handed parallel beta-helix repeat-containing protein [Candidatus Cohnella colombiensis]|uniref:Right-handed parallel beta-helix repeat-containing protein n=1 Tax=Candidatus Cohnella colombiensis TaxID=3121368 RepID=A0AA95JAX6_9BACL|nr:MAG: right-handed parallel beta-helix repeat-containing protein [Cohnella sp.]
MVRQVWINVTESPYLAFGDGIADDTTAINNAVNSGNRTIVFPEGIYNINRNIIFPKATTLIFAYGARFRVADGVTITINSKIRAGRHPLFVGGGAAVTQTNGTTVFPQWFGANGGGAIAASGSIASGSKSLTLNLTPSYLWNDQSIIVLHAGIAVTFPVPAPPSLTIQGTTGTTTYSYVIAALDKRGGITATSVAAQIATGYSQLDYSHSVKLTFPTSLRNGWAVYGASTNPSSSRGLLALLREPTTTWADTGNGPIDNSAPPWVPTQPPTKSMNNNLITSVISGEGTTTLTLKDAATTSVTSEIIMNNDTSAFQKSYNFLDSGAGGTLDLSNGTYHLMIDSSNSRAVYFVSNVRTVSNEQAIIQTYCNFTLDNTKIFSGKNGAATNWSFEGITFDGGNRVNTNEFAYWQIISDGAGPYTNFEIKDCEFRNSNGKALYFYSGNCSNYRITGCHFHHLNSNAMGVAGTGITIDHNLIENILLATASSYGSAESIILKDSVSCDIHNNRIMNFGNISLGGSSYKQISIQSNQIDGMNSGIGIGGKCEQINVSNNEIKITSRGVNTGHAIHFEQMTLGYDLSNVNVIGNNISYDGEVDAITIAASDQNRIAAVNISENTITATNSSKNAVEIRNARELTFSGNTINSTNLSTDVGLFIYNGASIDTRWTIVGNRIPNLNMWVPSNSICSNNSVGGIRLNGNRSVVSNNELIGASGSNTWGGLLNVAGSDNVITNNVIDLANVTITSLPAITENANVTNNIILGNQIVGVGTRKDVIRHNQGSTVINNAGFNRKVIELSAPPTIGSWNVGDRIFNSTPKAGDSIGWVCVTAGMAGSTAVFKSFGTISS